MRLLTATVFFSLATGCGYIGAPLPPALNLPRAVSDLRVEEVGDRVIIHFTTPALTTEDLPVTSLRAIELLAAPTEAGGDPGSFSQERWLTAARAYMIPATQSGAVDHAVPATEWARGKEMVFAVRATGVTGRVSEISNHAFLTVLPPLTEPVVTASNESEGVALSWSGNATQYKVDRAVLSDPEPKLEQIAETAERRFVDSTAAYSVRYRYVVTGHSGANVRSLPSKPVEITPVDVFPPATPAGLAAVAVGNSVDLSWARNTEPDLAGYTVLRAVDDGAFTVHAEGVALPTFSDAGVQAGKRYRYVVIAIDKLGNQSGRSPEATVRIE